MMPAWHWMGAWLSASPVKTRAAAVACTVPAVPLAAADGCTHLLPLPFVHSLLMKLVLQLLLL
jgi:hypothetical protein